MAYAYEGPISFARRELTQTVGAGDLAVVGVPFDLGATYRPGTRLGPRAIREQSVFVGGFSSAIWPWTDRLFDERRVVDYGDVHFAAGNTSDMLTQVESTICSIAERGARALMLGGDHMISYPALKALAAVHGPLSLVHFDAHCDTWTSDEGLDHGTMFWHAVQDGLIDPASSIQVGIRTTSNLVGMRIVTVDELLASPVGATVGAIHSRVLDNPVYVTFDIDFLDPAFAPGTGTPVAGGPSSQIARQLLHGLRGLNVVGADLVEVSPPYDHAQTTAITAAALSLDLLYVLHHAKAPSNNALMPLPRSELALRPPRFGMEI